MKIDPRAELFGFLESFNVGFECCGILVLSFEFGLELFDEKLETTNFVAKFVKFRRGRSGDFRRRGWRGRPGCGWRRCDGHGSFHTRRRGAVARRG